MPHTGIHFMFSVIQQMIHRVRTSYWALEQTYGGDTYEVRDTYP